MNINSKTIFTGDNLPIMRGMNSESVDLIYLDPPFNSNANYAAPIGSEAAGAEFKDTWTLRDVDITWLDLIEAKHPALNRVIHAAMSNSDKSYLIYMAVRLLEMHRILKDSGSIYLHCDPTMSHYLKLVMDTIFGKQHFQNEIIWCYERGSRRKSQFGRKHDVILFYSKTKNYVFDSDAVRVERRKTHMKVETDLEGRTWQVKKDAKSGKVYRYSTDVGVLCPDWWIGIQQLNRNEKERLGYPTQKPLALLDRIIKASSNEGHVVFDPFCGTQPPASGTGEHAEPVNDNRQTPSMNGNETHQTPSLTDNDSPKIVALLENQVADLKSQLAQASDRETALITEKSKLLDLTDRLQKQNEVLMLPPPAKKRSWLHRLTGR